MTASKGSQWWRSLLFVAVACGAAGCEGPVGPAGGDGTDGTDGMDGRPGMDGRDGPDGVAGADGSDGVDGADGRDGVDATRRPARLLDEDLDGWFGDNRTRLNRLVEEHGVAGAAFSASNRPVAVFDWDNTVIKNDIGDATFVWMIQNDRIKAPAAWAETSLTLSAEAVLALDRDCPLSGLAAGEPLRTSDTACGDAIWDIYANNRVPGSSAPAWADPVTTRNNYQYAWFAQMLAGYAPSEVRAMAGMAFDEHANAAEGRTVSFGLRTTGVTGWLRLYDEIRDLIETMQENGFDVWVVSASPQHVVEAVAAEVGVARSRVIGIRTVIEDGLLGHRIERCADEGEDELITFDVGKRCWINRVIFRSAEPLVREMDAARRPVFVAGDSDTDIAMLKDASDLSLVINRGKIQTVCNAYQHLAADDGEWIVQPMFIGPRACRATPYPCSTATDHDGAAITDDGHPEAPITMDYADEVCPP